MKIQIRYAWTSSGCEARAYNDDGCVGVGFGATPGAAITEARRQAEDEGDVIYVCDWPNGAILCGANHRACGKASG